MQESPQKQVDLEEQIRLATENAKNGITADLIRSLDLSTEDSVEILRQTLSPFSKVKHKILDKNGNDVFSFKTSSQDLPAEYFLNQILYRFSLLSTCIRDSSHLLNEFDLFGHELIKIGSEGLSRLRLSGDEYPVFSLKAEYSNQDRFLSTLEIISDFTATSLNDGLPGAFLGTLFNIARKKEISEEFMKNHPNYSKIEELKTKAYKLFDTLREVFTKYLSNIIYNPDYLIQVDNPSIDISQLDADYKIILPMMLKDEASHFRNLSKEAKEPKIQPEVEAQTRMFIERIDEYQKALDFYNSHLTYARPQS